MEQATLSDLKIGNTVLIKVNHEFVEHIIRKRLDVAELKKHKIYKYPKEETPEEYAEYKRIIKLYASQGNLFKK